MKKKNFVVLLTVLIFSVGLGLAGGHILFQYCNVYKVCYSEAGVSVKPADFLKNRDARVIFAPDSEPIAIDRPGEYQIRLKNGRFTFKSTLIIEDTIAPRGQAAEIVTKLVGNEIVCEDFITEIIDATPVQLSFAQTPDPTLAGRQTVNICLTDSGGNQTVLSAVLLLSAAAEALTIEAGEPLPGLFDFVIAAETASFYTDLSAIDSAIPGDYVIGLDLDGEVFEAVLHIIDTQPPVFATKDITGFTLLPRKAADFVAWCEDASPVEFHFLTDPDLSYCGEQEVTVIARDGGGNETNKTALLTLEADTEAPVIKGAADLEAQAGDVVVYKKHVVAIDNCPDGLEFIVDQSAVDIDVAGTYPVTYLARDFAGNEDSVTVTLTVRPKVYDLEEIYAKADEVLERIFTEDMTPRDKLWAIYRYNMNNIFFEPHSEKETWVRAAYEGLFDRRGDCFVYASTAKVLLDRAGIKNEDIEKVVTSRRHYWHLVDIGDGWYHFDTTPRSDHPTIFMWTDAQLMEYSAQSYNSHRYDRDIYPSDGREIN